MQHRFRTTLLAGIAAVAAACWAQAAHWRLTEPRVIDDNGARPSLWNGTVAYLDGPGGSVMFFDGEAPETVRASAAPLWEPVNAGGTVAWRQVLYGTTNKEVFRWDGLHPIEAVNISHAESVDSDIAGAANGDLIWSRDYEDLVFYDHVSNEAVSLGIRGIQPAVFVTPYDMVTYVYVDPDTNHVHYFDGDRTHDLGLGASGGAFPSLWNGTVAWIGIGEGGYFVSNEIYLWRRGRTTRVTNNNDTPHVLDQTPRVWKDLVIWARSIRGLTAPPEIYIWDGEAAAPLTESGGAYPSFHNGQITWEGEDGLVLADLIAVRNGDCNSDGLVDLDDYTQFEACLNGPAATVDDQCRCFDFDGSDAVDLQDFLVMQTALVEPPGVPGDCTGDGRVDLIEYTEFAYCMTGPDWRVLPGCDCYDYDRNGRVELGDFAVLQAERTGR
jgi:hypothetical protein